jgi:hypothetical protein
MDASSILTTVLTCLSIGIILLIVLIEGIKILLVLKKKSVNPNTSTAAGSSVSPTVADLNEIENVLKNVLTSANPQSAALKIISNITSEVDGGQKQTIPTSSSGDQKATQ